MFKKRSSYKILLNFIEENMFDNQQCVKVICHCFFLFILFLKFSNYLISESDDTVDDDGHKINEGDSGKGVGNSQGKGGKRRKEFVKKVSDRQNCRISI